MLNPDRLYGRRMTMPQEDIRPLEIPSDASGIDLDTFYLRAVALWDEIDSKPIYGERARCLKKLLWHLHDDVFRMDNAHRRAAIRVYDIVEQRLLVAEEMAKLGLIVNN